ncbi:MAG: hypothetical protein CL920_22440 [Deltaproteobacteria bacterium]|nr:hypothetical protein [Deltaproteobacteria bacterium]MBU51458.1 hypothetical protein [Deltaproteobacteria bacterium]|tara:strand:- start:3837 stop:5795 length:1959 start_codon:yes stop_codon:yes gene_type:complete
MSFLDLHETTMQQWEAFMGGETSLSQLPHALVRCWQRALSLHVDPKGPENEPILQSKLIQERHQELEPLMSVLPGHLLPLAESLSTQHFKLLFANAEGVVLEEWGGGEFAPQAQKVRLIRGSVWSEEVRGTNAIGTVIAEKCPVAVHGPAHFLQQNHNIVCYAAPIFDVHGQLLGVLDATSFSEAANPAVMASIIATARALEEWLRYRSQQRHGRVRTLALQRLMETFPGPVLLVQPDGHIQMANVRAQKTFPALLGMDSINGMRGASIQTILGGLSFRDLHHDEIVEFGPSMRFRLEIETLFDEPNSPLLCMLEPMSSLSYSQGGRRCPEGVVLEEETFSALLGDDPALIETLKKASRLARSKLPLLLCSETGTGKELLARAIHKASPRSEGPFVPLNCAALSPQLLASELFGYAPNAFTGAAPAGKEGHIAAASGGTLFLDEIAETPPEFQAMLLRLLEDGSFYRVGETRLMRADVRLVCATCRNLEALMEEGSFRRDLFYRIRGSILSMPPVRERKDVEMLVGGLLCQIAEELALESTPYLTVDAMALLSQHDWPGNVRELRHVLYCAAVLAMPDIELTEQYFIDALPDVFTVQKTHHSAPATIEDTKLTALQRALEQTKGNVSAAARKLGVARSTIYRMMQRTDNKES